MEINSLKSFIHTSNSTGELVSYLNSGEFFLSTYPSMSGWAIEHWFREGNKKYFDLTGTLYYPNCDGGFRPFSR